MRGCIICSMPSAPPPEFNLRSPLSSALAVIRAVLLSPRGFYGRFSAEGPLGEPTAFVVLVGAVAGTLTAAVALFSNLVFGELGAGVVLVTLGEALAFALLSPLVVGVVAGVYLLAINTFVGRVATFREVYRVAAYAWSAMVFAWIPLLGAFAVTYALMILMGIAVRVVYRASLLTAVITALVAFVPLGVALIWIRVATATLIAA